MDMLIALSALPSLEDSLEKVASQGVVVRRAMAYERGRVISWVRAVFGELWASECAVAFGRQPVGCYIAVKSGVLCGFCCLESTYRNFLGPIGVDQPLAHKGIGRALALSVLYEMRFKGYVYAIVGDAGEPGFFESVAGAMDIPGAMSETYPPKLS